MKKLSFYLLSTALLLSGCAVTGTASYTVTKEKPALTLAQEQTWKLMIGKWYGSQPTKEGGTKQEIMERSAQGTYKITFRISDQQGVLQDSTEIGVWGVSGGVYFSILRAWLEDGQLSPADPGDPYHYNAYRIIRLDNETFDYEGLMSGNRYTLKKVSPDFKFPQAINL